MLDKIALVGERLGKLCIKDNIRIYVRELKDSPVQMPAQPAFTISKSIIETSEQFMKAVPS